MHEIWTGCLRSFPRPRLRPGFCKRNRSKVILDHPQVSILRSKDGADVCLGIQAAVALDEGLLHGSMFRGRFRARLHTHLFLVEGKLQKDEGRELGVLLVGDRM